MAMVPVEVSMVLTTISLRRAHVILLEVAIASKR